MGDYIASALEEADRVVKKQKTCATKTLEVVTTLANQIDTARQKLESSPDGGAESLRALSAKLSQQDFPGQLVKVTKDLHGVVAKLGKALDRAFLPDISQATRDITFDSAILDLVLAQHFLQEGDFEVGERFIEEAGIPDGDAIKEPYKAMHQVLRETRAGNLGPALQWAEEHRSELVASSGERAATAFEFKLYRLQFLDVLAKQGQKAALRYARQHFGRFQKSQLQGIQRLMGCLCYIKRPASSPYTDLLAPSLWDDAARDFARQCCGLLGQASESPLLVATAAGSVALPTLLKLAGLLKDRAQDLVTGEQLPVELELGREFVFRSVFSCPVSREQSSPSNPPMLLPCGHVLCKGSILKIAKSATRSFKCPYCPLEASPATCRQLQFPPMQ